MSLVAVTGLACKFPGAPDTDAFWDLLTGEREGLTRRTDDELAAAGSRGGCAATPTTCRSRA